MKKSNVNNEARNKLLDAAFLEIYQNGYHGAATANILKRSGVPRGGMYHYFDSKKSLALAVINERLIPKINAFFEFERVGDENIFQSLERIFTKMSTHELLITNGCPLHRLMVEMAPLDSAFDAVLTQQFKVLVEQLSEMLQGAVQRGELITMHTQTLARFIITSSWGEISLSPVVSSKENFLEHASTLLKALESFKKPDV